MLEGREHQIWLGCRHCGYINRLPPSSVESSRQDRTKIHSGWLDPFCSLLQFFPVSGHRARAHPLYHPFFNGDQRCDGQFVDSYRAS